MDSSRRSGDSGDYLEIALTPSALKSGAKSASTYESVARTDPGEIFAQIHRVLQTFLDRGVLHPKSGTSQLLLTESQNFFRIPETLAHAIPLYLAYEEIHSQAPAHSSRSKRSIIMLAQDLTPLAAQTKELNKNSADLTNDKNCEESTKSLHSKSATPAMCQLGSTVPKLAEAPHLVWKTKS